MQIQSPGQEDLLKEEMATHSSILTWRIPQTEKPGGRVSTGSQSQTWLERHSTHCGIAWSCHVHKYLDLGRLSPVLLVNVKAICQGLGVVPAYCGAFVVLQGFSFHTGVGFVSHLHCTDPHHTFSNLVVWLLLLLLSHFSHVRLCATP